MKIFLYTAFETSETYYLGEEGMLFQGVAQGSGAAPALWMIISIFLIKYSHRQNIRMQF